MAQLSKAEARGGAGNREGRHPAQIGEARARTWHLRVSCLGSLVSCPALYPPRVQVGSSSFQAFLEDCRMLPLGSQLHFYKSRCGLALATSISVREPGGWASANGGASRLKGERSLNLQSLMSSALPGPRSSTNTRESRSQSCGTLDARPWQTPSAHHCPGCRQIVPPAESGVRCERLNDQPPADRQPHP